MIHTLKAFFFLFLLGVWGIFYKAIEKEQKLYAYPKASFQSFLRSVSGLGYIQFFLLNFISILKSDLFELIHTKILN